MEKESEYETNMDTSFFVTPITEKIKPSPLQLDIYDLTQEERKLIPAEGRRIIVKVSKKEHLETILLKSDSASLIIKELDFSSPSSTAKYCTILEMIETIISNLKEIPVSPLNLEQLIQFLEEGARGEHVFTLVIDDPLCRSQIEPKNGVKVEIENYQRTWEQLEEFDLTEYPKVRYLQELGVEQLLKLIQSANKVVCLSGAGSSVESGIQAWRNTKEDDIWKIYDENALNLSGFLEKEEIREKYWHKTLTFWRLRKKAIPNASHSFFTKLKEKGKLLKVITQNIDNLYFDAGLTEEDVICIHGTSDKIGCLNCKKEFYYKDILEELEKGVKIPKCLECGGMLKTRTILFGEKISESLLEGARNCIQNCDLLIIVGSSLVVNPVATFPSMRCENVPLVIVNLSTTKYDEFANVLIQQKCGETFQEIINILKW